MKVSLKADLPDIDEVFQEHEDEVVRIITETCEKWLQVQKSQSDFKNHTWNLRNAPGYAIIKKGEIIHMNIPSDGAHAEAVKKTTDFINANIDTEFGVILADGMEYASFVSSKGYDVLDTAALGISGELNTK